MIKTINKENKDRNSVIGDYRANVLSKMEELIKNLSEQSGIYDVESSCLSAWKSTFLEAIWSLFSSMMPVKLREQECLLMQSCVLLSDKRCSFLPGESFITPVNSIKVNTVSPLYRVSRASSVKERWEKYVPFLRLTGEWLLDYGFEIGKKYETFGNKNQLILKIREGCNGRGSGSGRISTDNEDRTRNMRDGIGERLVKDSSITEPLSIEN